MKYFNKSFFSEESEAMWYALGLSYATHSTYTTKTKVVTKKGDITNCLYENNQWQSSSRDLIEKIKSLLDSQHKMSSIRYKNIREEGDDFFVHQLRIKNQELWESLAKRGLNVHKKERRFPESIQDRYLSHFIRGFFDAQVSCQNPHDRPSKVIHVYYNLPFLKDLYNTLVEHACVKGGRKIEDSPLYFSGSEVLSIRDFIYQDWRFIYRHGLYLPEKKNLFDVQIKRKKRKSSPAQTIAKKKIYRAKRLVLTKRATEIAGTLGYYNSSNLARQFRRALGITISQYREEMGAAQKNLR